MIHFIYSHLPTFLEFETLGEFMQENSNLDTSVKGFTFSSLFHKIIIYS